MFGHPSKILRPIMVVEFPCPLLSKKQKKVILVNPFRPPHKKLPYCLVIWHLSWWHYGSGNYPELIATRICLLKKKQILNAPLLYIWYLCCPWFKTETRRYHREVDINRRDQIDKKAQPLTHLCPWLGKYRFSQWERSDLGDFCP